MVKILVTVCPCSPGDPRCQATGLVVYTSTMNIFLVDSQACGKVNKLSTCTLSITTEFT